MRRHVLTVEPFASFTGWPRWKNVWNKTWKTLFWTKEKTLVFLGAVNFTRWCFVNCWWKTDRHCWKSCMCIIKQCFPGTPFLNTGVQSWIWDRALGSTKLENCLFCFVHWINDCLFFVIGRKQFFEKNTYLSINQIKHVQLGKNTTWSTVASFKQRLSSFSDTKYKRGLYCSTRTQNEL